MSPRGPAPERRVVLVARRGRFAVAEPLFERGPQVPLAKGGPRVETGRMALVELSRRGARPLLALGSPSVARDVVDALRDDRGIHRGFPRRVTEEAEAASAAEPAEGPARTDLTELPTFTVDPAGAHDFDDAVSAERSGEGFRLWVHIADVTAHVRPGTALDSTAYGRATSVYAPGTVEPMLPPSLSDDACSLVPGVPRLAVSAELELSPSGEPRGERFLRSIIRSDARLDYEQLDRVFAGRERAPGPVAAPLELARRAAAVLAERRPASSIAVSTAEPEFEFDSGHVVGARGVEQTEAHRLIEHLMILCNERVATLLERRRAPTLYRVHEQPDPERIARLLAQLAALDLPTPPVGERISPSEAGELAGEASRLVAREAARRGHGRDAYTSLVLRALQQAHYTHRNLGHAGLASPAYTHFTSPIRRYPDVIAHRALLATIGAGESPPDPAEVREAGPHCSEREREAAVIERDADDVCAAFLLERELFESGPDHDFEGEVSGVIGAGAFVSFAGQLADVYEGFLPARRMRGERFDLDETETALIGQRTGNRVRIGDPVTVRVDGVEAPRGRVDLVPGGGGDWSGGRDGRGKGKAGAGRSGQRGRGRGGGGCAPRGGGSASRGAGGRDRRGTGGSRGRGGNAPRRGRGGQG